jgi:hypothetical protein
MNLLDIMNLFFEAIERFFLNKFVKDVLCVPDGAIS